MAGDPLGRSRPWVRPGRVAVEVGVRRPDAGIENGDGDALAGKAFFVQGICVDVRGVVRIRPVSIVMDLDIIDK